MRVDIWSDVVCPWCYVGKARFEKALDSFAHRDEVEVVYHSFELDPSSPRGQGESNLAMLSKKFGKSPDEARAALLTVFPDILRYDRSMPAAYPNGRTLTDDVFDTRLSFLSRGKIGPDGVGPHTDLLPAFPFLGVPNP